MGTYKRLPRGKPKSHDEFKDWSLHTLMWIKNHWVSAVELVAVGVLAFAVMFGAKAYGEYRAKAGAEAVYGAEKLAADSDEQMAALEEIAEDYSRYFAGKRAMMELGEMLVAKGASEDAIENFRRLADGSRNQPILRIAALYKLAEAQLAAGDVRGAAETYRKAAADPGNLMSLTSELLAAACLERAEDYDAAAELYRRIIEDAGDDDAVVRSLSEERLLWLAANNQVDG